MDDETKPAVKPGTSIKVTEPDAEPTPNPSTTEAAAPVDTTPESESSNTSESEASTPKETEATTSESEPSSTPPTDTPTPTVSTGSTGPRRRGKGLLLALLLLILLVAIPIVVALLQSNDQSKPKATLTAKKDVALMRVGVGSPFPETFYPAADTDDFSVEIGNQVFEGLTQLQENTKVVPNLAVSWSNPDSNTWLFKLRSNVHFHSGNILTAQAVKAALDASTTSRNWEIFGTTIKSVEVVDSQTVKITTNGPDPLLTTELSRLWIFDTKSGKADDPVNGSGPYQLKPDSKLTASSLDLVAFDQYHGSRPYTRAIHYQLTASDEETLKLLKENKLDLAIIKNESNFSQVGSGYTKQPVLSANVAFLVPNTLRKSTPLSNLNVRKAVYAALDPQALLKSRGLTGSPASQPVPSTIPGYDSTIKRPAYDPTAAKTQLTKAGYPSGFTATFTYFQSAEDLAKEVQKELAAIGVKLTLDPQTDGQALAKKAFGGGTDLFYISYSSDLLDTSDVLNGLLIGNATYSSDELNQLNSEASSQLNPTKRLQILQHMNRVVMGDLAVFPLYVTNSFSLAAKSNLQLAQQTSAGTTGLYFWQVYAK